MAGGGVAGGKVPAISTIAPLRITFEASVMMIGCTLRTATPKPLNRPTPIATAKISGNAQSSA